MKKSRKREYDLETASPNETLRGNHEIKTREIFSGSFTDEMTLFNDNSNAFKETYDERIFSTRHEKIMIRQRGEEFEVFKNLHAINNLTSNAL